MDAVNTPPASAPVDESTFAASIGAMPVAEIKRLVKEQTGTEIAATRKDIVVSDAYKAYLAHLTAPRAPEAPAVAPAVAPRVPKAAKAPEVPAAELVYEARSRTGQTFRKGGRVFTTRWEPIGTLTADEKSVLDKYSFAIQYRIKG